MTGSAGLSSSKPGKGAPTALSLAAEGGVIGLALLRLDLVVESGLALPFGGGAQLVRGVESSSEPKLRKSLKSGEGSAMSIWWESEMGVSRYRSTRCRSLPVPRTVLTDDSLEFLELLFSEILGGDLATCSSIISSRMRARFCRRASRSCSSCFVTAISRLLFSELPWVCVSEEVGESGGVGCKDRVEAMDGFLEVLFSF